MKKILVALALCMVSVIGFRANPITGNVEALQDSIETPQDSVETSIETLSDGIKPVLSTTLYNDNDRIYVQDEIIVIVKDGVYYDVLGRVIRYYR